MYLENISTTLSERRIQAMRDVIRESKDVASFGTILRNQYGTFGTILIDFYRTIPK